MRKPAAVVAVEFTGVLFALLLWASSGKSRLLMMEEYVCAGQAWKPSSVSGYWLSMASSLILARKP